jgi:hypothetical protein
MHIFHKWKSVIRERSLLQASSVFGTVHDISGLRTLDVCEKCGKLRAQLVSGSGESQEKIPETIFSDEELKKANLNP